MSYVCPTCLRRTKLPDFCCGSSMVASGSYVCPNCKSVSDTEGTCECGTEMIQV